MSSGSSAGSSALRFTRRISRRNRTREGYMRKGLLVAVVALALPAVAQAAPNQQAQCRQDVRDQMVAVSDEDTRGDFMSDFLFGNEPNIEGPFAPGGPNE